MTITDNVMFVIALLVFLLIFSLVLSKLKVEASINANLTRDYCCNGYYCSDTYYDNNSDLCVLSLSGETYKPLKKGDDV